ncbi:MAG: ATP-binding protein [Pseudomonadota bacterium]|nr:ATP-binding protein [Pseudomonadota bacterium]
MTLSIRRRLLLLLLTVVSGLWLLITWGVYLNAQHEVEELFDAQLAQSAQVLFSLLQHELEEEDDEEEIEIEDFEEHRPQHPYQHKLAFLVRSPNGNILLRSSTAPLLPQTTLNERYGDHHAEGHLWRVYTLKTAQLFIQTTERYDIRQELIGKIVLSSVNILLFALPLLAILIWSSISHSLKPLQQVANAIATQAPTYLQPLVLKKIPIEINILVEALNTLFKRLKQAFDNERRFTADAAHELRTPLAGIKTQAQVAQRAQSASQRQHAFQQLLLGVDRASHLVTQLLTLARMDAIQVLTFKPVNLAAVIEEVIVSLAPQALEKSIDLGLDNRASSTLIWGHYDSLSLLLGNLIDNALRYTPSAGEVTVVLVDCSADLYLKIIDTGPGIPPAQRRHIFERFYRGGQYHSPGSGLGLSIAKQIAQLHQVEIHLSEPQNHHGLQVEIAFKILK